MAGQSVSATEVEWRDGKRYLWILGAVIPLIPVAAWGLVEATGWDLFWYFGPVFVFGIIPLVDLLTGIDRNNPPD
jgi:alkane 1-monooxygenase